MSAVARVFLILIWIAVDDVAAVKGGSSDERILETQSIARKMSRQLLVIDREKNRCSNNVSYVEDQLGNVTKRIDDLYAGPFVANMALSSAGYKASKSLVVMLPDPVVPCIKAYAGTTVSAKQAKFTCIRQILWRYQFPDDKQQINLDIAYAKKHSRKQQLNKRNKPKPKPSKPKKYPTAESSSAAASETSSAAFSSSGTTPTPLKVRKEYRTLSLTERTRFHNALQVLNRTGEIRRFVRMHRRANRGAHRGPAFLPWHRVFITLFEDALREVDPSVTLPYWDSTKDDQMANPLASILWSEDYLGNGAGDVVTGPFINWDTNSGPLEREYAVRGRLVNTINLQRVMNRCYFADVTVPTGRRNSRIEAFHNRVHVWMGGHMRAVTTAPYDPVFYLHHCYIDYIWEKFRERQRDICGVDPETDYIEAGGSHNLYSPMAQMPEYQVIDGLSNYWTDEVFRYEETPSCDNNCGGSDVLECDGIDCIPVSRFGNEAQTTTSTPVWTTVTMTQAVGRKRRQAVELTQKMAVQIGNSKNGTKNINAFKPNPGRCNKYLDPGCLKEIVKDKARRHRPIKPKDEQEIVKNIVPRPRGPLFDLDPDGSDGRNIYTYDEDVEAYPARRKEFLAALNLAVREGLTAS